MRMYIIAIGWLYVTLLVAFNEASVFAGIVSFAFYGLLPCSLLIWLSGSKLRRQRRRHQELLANQVLDDGNRSNPEANQ